MGLRTVRATAGAVVSVLAFLWGMVPSASAFVFTPARGSPYAVEGDPVSVAIGDFDSDGQPDFAVGSIFPRPDGNYFVSPFVADGSGGFRIVSGSPETAPIHVAGGSVAAGEFDGTGKLDLAATTPNDGVAVLLGNGDGTFRQAPGSPVQLGREPVQVAVGDFTGDGKTDLVTVNADNTVSVLLGNGDGTFTQAPGSPIALGSGPPVVGSLAVGDFNRDGNLDLAITNDTNGTLSVLLGAGDGTFTSAPGSPIALGGSPQNVVVGDFNGDHEPDLAVNTGNGVTVLLGNGDGTFRAAPGSPLTPGSHGGLAIGDFNSDGKQDLALACDEGNRSGLCLWLGKGNGTFAPARGSPLPIPGNEGPPQGCGCPAVLAAGTIDGRPGLFVQAPGLDPYNDPVSLLLAPLPSTPPTAALSVHPNPVTTGTTVHLDASASADPLDRRIVDYRWDLGSGRFDHDTGSRPTISWQYHREGSIVVRVKVTNTAGKKATATATLIVRRPNRSAALAGLVELCRAPATGRCRIQPVRTCQENRGCVTADRVAAIDSNGRRAGVQRLNHARFRIVLAPGHYTLELLGDGPRIRARVMQRKSVTARPQHTTAVRFIFSVP